MGWQDFTQRVLPFMGADLLLSDLASKLAPNQVYIPTLENGYGGLVIATNLPSNAGFVTCQVVDATGIVPTWTQRQKVTTLDVAMFVPPYSYTTASALRITLTASVNQTINSTTFIWGTSSLAPSMQGSKLVRSDGRDYPVGASSATLGTASGGGGTVIAAPGAGLHILLMTLTAGGNAGGPQVDATVGGAVVHLVRFTGSGSATIPLPIPPQGVLLDANTSLTVPGIVGSVQTVDALYDVVA